MSWVQAASTYEPILHRNRNPVLEEELFFQHNRESNRPPRNMVQKYRPPGTEYPVSLSDDPCHKLSVSNLVQSICPWTIRSVRFPKIERRIQKDDISNLICSGLE